MQWEYDITDWHSLEDFKEIADKWGQGAWELVTVFLSTLEKKRVYQGIFKRPVQD